MTTFRHLLHRMRIERIRTFLSESDGSTLSLVALSFTALIGFMGMGIDLAHWYDERRASQNMVDAAAVAGAYIEWEGGTAAEIEDAAEREAKRNGYEDVQANSLIINPLTGTPPQNLVTPRVEVIVRRQVPLYFAKILFNDTMEVEARAVGGTLFRGTQCVISLSQTANKAVLFSGSTVANVGCGVASNSSSSEAIKISGNATLNANPAQAYGDISIDGSGTLNSQYPPLPFSPRVANPYSSLPPPNPPSTCDATGGNIQIQNQSDLPTMSGGEMKLCGNVSFKGNVTLDPGIYYIEGGDLDFTSNADVDATAGVTFILTGDPASNTGTVDINGGAKLDLEPVTTGPYEGLAFYRDPNAPAGDVSKYNGGSNLKIDGVIYDPTGHVEFSGNTNNSNGCLQIVSNTVTFTGNSEVKNDQAKCQAIGVAGNGTAQEQIVLVE